MYQDVGVLYGMQAYAAGTSIACMQRRMRAMGTETNTAATHPAHSPISIQGLAAAALRIAVIITCVATLTFFLTLIV
jgi:hypothetical protein